MVVKKTSRPNRHTFLKWLCSALRLNSNTSPYLCAAVCLVPGRVFSLIPAAAPSLTMFQQPWPSAPPQLRPNSFLPIFTSCSHCLGNFVLGFSLGRLPLPSVLSHPCVVPTRYLAQAGITAVTHFLLLFYCCCLLPEGKLGKIIRHQSGLRRVFSISNPLFGSYQTIYSLLFHERVTMNNRYAKTTHLHITTHIH